MTERTMTSLRGLEPLYPYRVFEHNGRDYHVRVGNLTSEKTVVIMHGVTGNSLDMAILGREFIEQGYRVLLPDLPGHGQAPAVPITKFDDIGDWLHGCLQAIGVVPDAIVANSFASAVCYNSIGRYGLDPSTRLVLGCPTPEMSKVTSLFRRSGEWFPASVERSIYNSEAGIWSRTAYLQIKKDKQMRRWFLESERLKRPFLNIKMINTLSGLLVTDNPYQKITFPEAVQCQTLVVMGSRDNVILKTTPALLQRLLPAAEFVTIPGVGHILHFEAYKEFASEVLARIKSA